MFNEIQKFSLTHTIGRYLYLPKYSSQDTWHPANPPSHLPFFTSVRSIQNTNYISTAIPKKVTEGITSNMG